MDYAVSQTPLSKSILAGLATGIIATVANLIYNFIFRGITRLSLLFSFINVSTIIFATMILCMVAGLIYYFIVFYLRKSSVIYTVLFLIITLLAVVLGMNIQRSADQHISRQFDDLYIGLMIITGLSGVFFVPWLTKHKNAFFD